MVPFLIVSTRELRCGTWSMQVRQELLKNSTRRMSPGISEIENELPHLNSTYKTSYRDFYDDETKQIITDWFHEDIKEFGYTF